MAAVAMVLVAAAPAAASWSAPRTVVTASSQVSEPTIAFGADGRALLSARLADVAGGVPSHGFSRLYAEQADGSFRGSRRLVLAATPVVFGRSRTALLRLPRADGDITVDDLDVPPRRLGYGFGRTDGSVARYRPLTARADEFSGGIAADARGDVAAGWVEHRGTFLDVHDQLLVAVRRPGRRIGRPAVLAGRGEISSSVLAFSAGGDLVVAWARDDRVEARVRRAGHGWGATQRLGLSRGYTYLAAAAAPDGAMVVAWGTQDTGEEANEPWRIFAARRAAGAHAFRGAQSLDVSQGIDRPAGRVVAAIDARGTATVAWSTIAGTRLPHTTYPARVARAPASQRFGPAQALAPSAAVEDLATGPDGSALVVYANLPSPGDMDASDQVFAAVRPAGAPAFAPGEPVSPVEGARVPQAAFDPRSGRPAVVWVRTAGKREALRYAEGT